MQNESGRSMVEMLGVLAIIGVLSVGGIMGYTTAMRKYYANEIVQAITLMAMSARSFNMGYGDTTVRTYQERTGELNLPQGLSAMTSTKYRVSLTFNTTDMCNLVESYFSFDVNQPFSLKVDNTCANEDSATHKDLVVFIKQ